MGKFNKNAKKGTPEINTGSMSDIIFMLLFFFMVITTMRESTLFVRINPPTATEVQKLEKKSLVSFIYIGPPMDAQKFGTEPRIQLNDQISGVRDIAQFIEVERQSRDEVDRPLMTTSIKADKSVKMGILTDVKQELRKMNALKINYSTAKGKEREN
ncbi:MAG: biopolymer transporter ExbD [Bacteroidales bacterium]|nr:biopolymer transporter ExbD [Bacteroidales bacterium]